MGAKPQQSPRAWVLPPEYGNGTNMDSESHRQTQIPPVPLWQLCEIRPVTNLYMRIILWTKKSFLGELYETSYMTTGSMEPDLITLPPHPLTSASLSSMAVGHSKCSASVIIKKQKGPQGTMLIQEPTGEACCREGTTKAKTECIFSPVYSSLCESCGRPGLWHKGLCWHK